MQRRTPWCEGERQRLVGRAGVRLAEPAQGRSPALPALGFGLVAEKEGDVEPVLPESRGDSMGIVGSDLVANATFHAVA